MSNGHGLSSQDLLSRLEKGFQEQQLLFQSTRDEVQTLKAGYTIIQRDVGTLTNAIEKLVARFEESRKTNWPLFTVIAATLPLIIGGFGFFITAYTSSSIAPVQTEIAQMQTGMKAILDQVKDVASVQSGRTKDLGLLAQTATANAEIINRLTDSVHRLEERTAVSATADASSQSDRRQLNERMQKVETMLSSEQTDRRSENAETRIQLREVEQQFHSVSNLENLRAAQQERLNSLMWEKTFPGSRYPNGTFFPTSIFQGLGGAASMQDVR